MVLELLVEPLYHVLMFFGTTAAPYRDDGSSGKGLL